MKRVFLLVLTFCLIVCAKVNPTAPALNNGCYSISTTDELYGFAAIVNGTFEVGRAAESSACGKLENDVWANDSLRTYCGNKVETNETTGEEDSVYVCYRYSFAESKFVEVDPATVEPRKQWIPLKNFSGSFDGQGHAIWELENVEDSTQDNLGFIESVVGGTKASPVVIRNLTLRKAELNGRDTVGGVVAKNTGYLLLDNVASLMSINARNHAGSFVGRNEGHLVVKKGVTSSVNGEKFVGGAVGSNSGTVDVDSLALKIAFDVYRYDAGGYGTYIVANSHAGLILGLNEKSASFLIRNIEVDENSVWADSVVGGLVGVNEKDAEISISTTAMVYYLATDRKAKVGGFVAVNRGIVDIANSYIRGGVSGTMSGCFVGVNEDSLSITNSYSACTWESVSGDPIVAGCGGRISLKNTFYLENCGGFCSAPVTASCADNMGAKPVTDNEVRNGVLAIHLHNNKGGDVWGQDTSKDYYPKLHATFGTYEFKLHLGYIHNVGSNGQWCSPDTNITSYVYTKGVDQFPVCSQYGYEFLGWAYEDNPDSIVTSIGKTEYGDIDLIARWAGDPVDPPQDEDGCYLVSSVGELYGVSEIKADKMCVKLMKDIVINVDMDLEDEFHLRDWLGLYGFNGVFDGQGHTISGMYDHGLFTDVLEGDTLVIKNLGIEESHVINQGRSVFVRSNRGVVIIDSCFSSFPSGGFVESNNGHLYVSNSYNTGSIYTGSSIVSTNNGVAVLDHVYNTGTVNCSGGLLGSNSGKAFISNSYNVGKITKNCGSGRVGGIAGFNNGEMEIVNCYSANNFDTAMNAGGFVGNHFLGSLKIINSYSAGIHAGNYGIVGIPDSPPLHGDRYAIYLDNVYYSAGVGDTTGLGIQATPAVFENGYVAKLLHDYVQKDENGDVVVNGITGEIWGQEVGVDPLPVFKGVLVGAADSAGEGDIIDAPGPVVASSSSSKVKSSSSSNGEIDSSSSAKSGNSSDVKSSSSKAKSSSSSSRSAKSSSSSKTNVVSHLFERGAIHIEASQFGRGILISGIPARLQFVMFDMLGHKVASGVSGCSGIALEGVPAGRYYLLAADGRFVVNVRP